MNTDVDTICCDINNWQLLKGPTPIRAVDPVPRVLPTLTGSTSEGTECQGRDLSLLCVSAQLRDQDGAPSQ